jgi:hypothetical protein
VVNHPFQQDDSKVMKSFVFRLLQKYTYLGCSLEDKQKIFHIKKQLQQPLQVLLGACSCSHHQMLLLSQEYQYLELLFVTSNQQSQIELITQCQYSLLCEIKVVIYNNKAV